MKDTNIRFMAPLTLVFILIVGGLSSSFALAQKPDKKGTKDYPLISRFDGFTIDAYQESQFDRYTLPLGPAAGLKSLGETKTLEGKITKIHYLFSGKNPPSLLQVYKSYEQVFANQDVEVLFSCLRAECGVNSTDLVKTAATTKLLLNGFMAFGEHAYQAVKLNHDGMDIFVALYIRDERGRLAYELHFIEVQEMNTGNISMSDIQTGIEKTGKQVFYGLYFDTGKASLKQSANDELTLLGQYLNTNREKSYYVVGHTDNTGSYEGNLSLSLNRARSIIKALNEEHGVALDRLKAVGVGPVSPVEANLSDTGRAKNRRVELVLQ